MKNLFNAFKKYMFGLKSWEIVDGRLKKKYTFDDFVQAMNFVNKLATIAEKLNHHPDIFISYNKVEITLWTHEKNTLTTKDFTLAKEIEKINPQ